MFPANPAASLFPVMTRSREPTGAVRLRQTPLGAVVEIDGPIDCATAPIVKALLERGVIEGQPVDLDLSQVPFIAAAGLSMLVTCEFEVRLLNPSALTVRVLELVGLDERFRVVLENAERGVANRPDRVGANRWVRHERR